MTFNGKPALFIGNNLCSGQGEAGQCRACGDFGVVGDLRPEVLENPARLIRGKKQRNPTWKSVGDWAYFKAPTTKEHKFSPHNHNWTAGVLYEKDACWVECRQCPVQCLTKDQQMTLDSFSREELQLAKRQVDMRNMAVCSRVRRCKKGPG